MELTRRRAVALASVLVVTATAVTLLALAEHEEDRHHFSAVDRNHLYRSRQPHESDLKENAPRREIRRIVNLRPEKENPADYAEELRTCKEMGITMTNLPVKEVVPTMEQVRDFLKVARQTEGATLVHCEHGRNRTSVMVAAYRIVVQDWSMPQVEKEMSEFIDLGHDHMKGVVEFLSQVYAQREQLRATTAP